MKTSKMLMGFALASLTAFTACKKETSLNDNGFGARGTKAGLTYAQAATLPVKNISGLITADRFFSVDTVYELEGIVAVKNGATLEIEAGTYIKGKVDANGKPGILVITRGSNIEAAGDADNPIIFTSYKLLDNNAGTVPAPGDFGGVVILGNARTNAGQKAIEGIDSTATLPFDNKYGQFSNGSYNDSDNSGTLSYVRVEFPGYAIAANNEINGVTFGGVGSGTTIDHIQVSWSKDDSFEWFGGTVDASNLVSYAADDDNFDFDNGYTGEISYSVAIADNTSTHSTSGGNSDSNGIESDNNADAEDNTYSLTPKTNPTLSYVTVIGTSSANSGYRSAARIRRGSAVTVNNSVFTGYANGFEFNNSSESFASISSSSIHGFSFAGKTTAGGSYAFAAGNTTSTLSTAPNFGYTQPFYNVASWNLGGGAGTFAQTAAWVNYSF